MKHKKILILIPIIIIAIIVLVFIINNSTRPDANIMKENILAKYPYTDFVELDRMDVMNYFGIDTNELTNYVFLKEYTEYNENEEISLMPTFPKNMFIYISGEQTEYYYNVISGMFSSIALYEENQELVNLYTDYIVKKKGNSLYIIVGENKDKLKTFLDL